MNEINFQRSSLNGRIDYLFAIDDIEVVNEEAKLKNFDTIFRRKPKRTDMTEDESDEFLSRLNSDFDDEMDSFDTESNLGLFKNIAKMKDSQDQFTMSEILDDPMQLLNSQANPPLFLVNLTYTRVSSNQADNDDDRSLPKDLHTLEEYEASLKLYVQHFEIYIDKLMVGTTLKNFTKLQNDFMSLPEFNQRPQNLEEMNLNTSVSSLNLSMHKETSISTLTKSRGDTSKQSQGYKSIMANFGGVSVFAPDTETFEKDSNILCFHLGEIKIVKGNPEIDRSRRLLEDETEFDFKEVLDRNKTITKTLNCTETMNQLKLSKNTNSEQVIYEVSDINVALCGVSSDNSELSEQIKIVKNFDTKLIYDTPISTDSDFTAKIYLELDRIEFVSNKSQLSDLIELSQIFQKDIKRISGLASNNTKQDLEPEVKKSYLNSSGLQSVSIRYSTVTHNHEMSYAPIEESKLLEESSEDDEKFFDAYDALDDLDKDIYNQIQNKQSSMGSEFEQIKKRKSIELAKKSNKRKFIIISEMRGFTLSILHSERDRNLTPRSIHPEAPSIFSVKMNMFRFGAIQNQESLNLAVNMHSFQVQHCESKILYSKRDSSGAHGHDHYEESKSNQSHSNNQSNADEPLRHEPIDHFLTLSFVQNKNNIIESNSAVRVTLGSVNFDIDKKCVENALRIIPKNLEKLSKPSKSTIERANSHLGSPHGSFKERKEYEFKKMATLLHPAEHMKSGRARHNSFIKNYPDAKNISEQSSYFNDDNVHHEEETTMNNFSIRISLDEIQGRFSIGPSTSLEMAIVKMQNSCVLSDGVPKSFDLKIQQIGLIIPEILKLNLTSPEDNPTNALEIGYIFTTNEDHKYTDQRTSINLSTLTLTISTNNTKPFLSDLEDFHSLFPQSQSQTTDSKDHEIRIKQKEFREIIFEYKDIDVLLQDQGESTGLGMNAKRGLLVKNNQSLVSVNTESVDFYLKHTTDFFKNDQRDFPILALTKIFAKISNKESDKKKNYFEKQTLKVKEISITL